MDRSNTWRKTSQELMPPCHTPTPEGQYDVYPGFPIGSGKIEQGYEALARLLMTAKSVIIDGYIGILWEDFRKQLEIALLAEGIHADWVNVNDALRKAEEIQQLVEPFLGGSDPLFGTRFTGTLRDFFDPAKLAVLRPTPENKMQIVYGCGAVLAGSDGLLVYVDLPKNEVQFRSRAGSIYNLGFQQPGDPKKMYKQFYFVDWVALNNQKAELLPKIDLVVDGQRPDHPMIMTGEMLREGLRAMTCNYFRVRPWFEAGAWGGQWMKEHIPQLPKHAPNYAWSFELIAPENGLAFESDGCLLEVSFDFLMYYDAEAVVGACARRFGYEFPIRFDFLDTFEGGNLSVQCHPSPEYIQQKFGETFTQDETYYILDAKSDARVYLGFQESIEPDTFRQALERSFTDKVAINIDQYVNSVPVKKHDLVLIPYGTIHGAGEGNLVLEISATPYIFTMKMYDWMRLDLDGKPRTLNIDRAFDNLNFERRGHKVQEELVSHPYVLKEGPGWTIIHQPTTPVHFYDVHRLEFESTIDITTDGSCHVLNLVEGQLVELETANGIRQRFNYAETFVVSAAAGSYRLINLGTGIAKVVKAFLKEAAC